MQKFLSIDLSENEAPYNHIWNLFSERIFNAEEKKRKNDAKEGK